MPQVDTRARVGEVVRRSDSHAGDRFGVDHFYYRVTDERGQGGSYGPKTATRVTSEDYERDGVDK